MSASGGSYERLAAALDALPHGYPKTSSGVELLLLKKAFSPEEAALAGHLNRKPETVAEIASRAGMDEPQVRATLENLVPRRLVLRLDEESEDRYRLGPFMIGWYDANVRLLDKEFAELGAQYLSECDGERIFSPRPGLLGVVPVRGSLESELLQPHEDIAAHFSRHERFLVRDCACQREQELRTGQGGRLPIRRCGFEALPPQTPLSENVLDREEASRLLAELELRGLAHLAYYGYTEGAETAQFVGTCNCSGLSCNVLRAVTQHGLPEGPQRSNYRAVIDPDECISCGECIERCPVQTIAQDEEMKAKVRRDGCIGCGACVIGCASEAIELVPVPENERFDVPHSMAQWEEMRIGQ
jgi:Pyruvate/2-oxoacid:ferredoxin oxidoreductase delta subunit